MKKNHEILLGSRKNNNIIIFHTQSIVVHWKLLNPGFNNNNKIDTKLILILS